MARPKSEVKEFKTRIDSALLDNIDQIILDIQDAKLDEKQKEELLIEAEAKNNELQQNHKEFREVEVERENPETGAIEKVKRSLPASAAQAVDEANASAKDMRRTKSDTPPAGTKAVRFESLAEVDQYQKENKLVGIKYFTKTSGLAVIKAVFLLFAILFAAESHAVAYDEAVLGNNRCRVSNSGVLTCYDAIKFETNLLSDGRYGQATLILESSSTPIEAAQLAYAVIQKRVGGAGGLDNLGVGTELANGTEGQTITLQVILLEANGSWVVTPDTSTGFAKLTFDANKEYATLTYINDTIGWVITGTNATIA